MLKTILPMDAPGLSLPPLEMVTVPLTLHDRVIGIFNIESRQRAAFNEDDRQFAEIFGRYVAIALNILDLMVVERVGTAHKVADDVCTRPWLSVTGTRCTRCGPPSCFKWLHASSPLTRRIT